MASEEEDKLACSEIVGIEDRQQLLERWLRHMENLRDTEEMVHICEPETGRNLSDEEEVRSIKDLINCQGGKVNFQVARWAMEGDQWRIS
jgi:hypothetical protein